MKRKILDITATNSAPTAVTDGFAIWKSDPDIPGAADDNTIREGLPDGIDAVDLTFLGTRASGTLSASGVRLYGMSRVSGAVKWYPLGTGADATKGFINNQTGALGEVLGNEILHRERVTGIKRFERLAIHVPTMTGTTVTLKAWVEDVA